MYFVRRYSISVGNESSLEALERFIRSNALWLQNGIAKGEDTYLILVEEEQWSDSSRFFVKYRPVKPDLQPIATVEAKSSVGVVSFRVKVEVYPFVSGEVVVKEQGERFWESARVSWGRKFIFRRDSDFAEEVLE
jgi:hypothetical protein